MAKTGVRLTFEILKILTLFVAEPARSRWPHVIAKDVKMPSNTVRYMLEKLERNGWLSSRVEVVNQTVAGRSPRRLFKITSHGLDQTRQALSDLRLR